MVTNVLEYLESAAEKYPNKIAFASDSFKGFSDYSENEKDESLFISYKELVLRAKAAGSFISHKFPDVKNRPIFVLIDREVSVIVAFFAVLYSGNFYVPIEKSLPENRIKMMVDTMNPAAVITFSEDFDFELKKIWFSEAVSRKIDGNTLLNIRNKHVDTNPVYAIFTSGSTGVPKAVLISHMSVIDLAEQFTKTFNFSENNVFGNQAPFDFDVSTKDIYCTIKNGGTMYIIPKKVIAFPLKMIEFLNKNKVNTLIWSASALRIIKSLNVFRVIKPEYLKYVMFSGEVMPNKVLNYWRENLPDVTYVNLYGPTEITCNCTYFIVDRKFSDNEELPIGKPFENTDVFLYDDGEIYVRGSCLALGYYNNPEKTNEAFIQNPCNNMYYEKVYKTGDLGRYNENHELMYCGRKDFQVKCMGHRIELLEIESAVNAFEFLDFSCCLFQEKKDRLVLLYQAAEDKNALIATELSRLLPKYMIPRKMVCYKELPLNKNGKIDRVYLAGIIDDM